MNISEKVAYLKGLADGLEISSDSKNGKILKGILDVLEDIAGSIHTLEDENETLENYIAEIDEDLGYLEEDFEKNLKFGHVKFPPPPQPHNPSEPIFVNDADIDDIDFEDGGGEENESAENEILDGVFEMKCPHCKKRIFIETDDILNSEDLAVECPECGEDIDIIFDESGGHSCPGCAGHGNGHGDLEDDGDDIEIEDDVSYL